MSIMNRESIYQDITRERDRQDVIWGGPDHDDQQSLMDWTTYIGRWSQPIPYAPSPEARDLLIKVAALAVAAIESLDRRSNEG